MGRISASFSSRIELIDPTTEDSLQVEIEKRAAQNGTYVIVYAILELSRSMAAVTKALQDVKNALPDYYVDSSVTEVIEETGKKMVKALYGVRE
jgi:hypothetical protein